MERLKIDMNAKVFSLRDLIDMGLISRKDIEDWIRYQEAKAMVNDLFKGMF